MGEILRPFLVRNSINLVFLFIKTLRNFIYDTKNHQGRKVVLIFCSE
ncbi:Hypothetical protein EUBREC_1217 [Agathobacter rectalis ATCC 33656]|uniref:Uncharacterized protein n=1 Tax=Agathobacter rectalis (strain ATCC 33656 / DSM 3377 / JCM 17463 / KCTC 5835 / VPI 0990) TaxID=515619 RepID=C4ZHG5_AGARV|nr:Hypothetical protein EUBREC_1217 [Agathobacter rectalis ATCC 33656]